MTLIIEDTVYRNRAGEKLRVAFELNQDPEAHVSGIYTTLRILLRSVLQLTAPLS